MPKLDQFESVFRAAHHEPYAYATVDIEKALLVTDLSTGEGEAFRDQAATFLAEALGDLQWEVLEATDYEDLGALIDLVKERAPDLVVSYRNLKSSAWKYPYSLGDYVHVLTQATTPPVLLLPTPHDPESTKPVSTRTTLVVADHLTGDHHLVNFGVRFTAPGGTLHLTHVESLGDFALYIAAISKIPAIDTDLAAEELERVLLKQPQEYIENCRKVLAEHDIQLDIHATVTMGHRVATYSQLIRKHEVDLLVLDTKHAHQLAMDSVAHRLAVEFRSTPILML